MKNIENIVTRSWGLQQYVVHSNYIGTKPMNLKYVTGYIEN